jgi:hypothetical protein
MKTCQDHPGRLDENRMKQNQDTSKEKLSKEELDKLLCELEKALLMTLVEVIQYRKYVQLEGNATDR